jgi:DNA-binding NtrC family response regulator
MASEKFILAALKDEAGISVIRECFGPEYEVDSAADMEAFVDRFRRRRYEITFLDLDLILSIPRHAESSDYSEFFTPLWQAFPTAPLIVIARQDRKTDAVAAVRAGAANYVTYPLNPHELTYVADRLWAFAKFDSELNHLRETALQPENGEEFRTHSPKMREVYKKIQSVAPTKTTVLLTGETGSGKGVLARLIHRLSNRQSGPFISVHCGAIPDTLLESEFFGHEKGAFTGALRRKLGKFQIADGGTIFLDEIGTISPAAQIKMLQVLQERRFSLVGGEASIEVDVRLVAASNMDLSQLCKEGRFREDLYYRLNVFPIEPPPLRERIEDLPLLVDAILKRLNKSEGKNITACGSDVMSALRRYTWPGNIRELENLVERAYILETGTVLSSAGFPSELFGPMDQCSQTGVRTGRTLEEVRRAAAEQAEMLFLREALAMHHGRIRETADVAGVTTRQLHNLLTKYHLKKEDFK